MINKLNIICNIWQTDTVLHYLTNKRVKYWFLPFQNTNTGCDVEDPDALVIIYDVTDRDSFRYAEGRLREIRSSEESCRPTVIILVANKEDLVRNRVVSAEGKNV